MHHRGRYVLTCTIATFRLPPNNAASPTQRSKRVEQSLLIGWHLNPCQGCGDIRPHAALRASGGSSEGLAYAVPKADRTS